VYVTDDARRSDEVARMFDPPPTLERWSLVATGVTLATVPAARLTVAPRSVATVLEGAVPLLLLAGVLYAGVTYARRESPTFTAVVTAWTLSTVGGMVVVALWIVTLSHLIGGGLAFGPLVPIVTSTGALVGLWLGTSNARWRERDDALRRERERISFLNELLRHYVLNAAQVIVGRAEVLVDRTDGDDATAIARTGRRLSRHVQQMRALARVEDDRWPVDLSAAVAAASDGLAEKPHVDLTVDVPDACPVIADDALEVLIEGLLFRAVHLADDAAVTIRLVAACDDGGVTVTVDDDAGDPVVDAVDPASIDTAHGVHEFQRYLVVTLAERYGGSVTVTDRDDGTRTEVWLPAPDGDGAFGNP
jgi:signal transduction histidine kinase